MFIIWGSRGLSKHIDSGRFYCPRCDRPDVEYDLKSVREWFTVYWIPIFPVGGHQRFVECRRCGQAYQERVLDMEPPAPPSEEDVQDALTELDFGASAEKTAGRLERLGFSPASADRLIDEYTKGELWRCKGCDRHYSEKVRDCPKCG